LDTYAVERCPLNRRKAKAMIRSATRSPKSEIRNPQWACCLLLLLAIPVVAATPVINGFNLARSFTCGERYFLMWADGMELGLTIRLTQAGQPDIIATHVGGIEYDGEALGWVRGVFALSPGVAGGFWSVVITNPGGESATLTDALEVVADCPRGRVGDLYVCNSSRDTILQFDGMTGVFVCVFAGRPPGLNAESFTPLDLAWAANGHLWVSSATSGDNPSSVAEYDGNTGAFLRFVVAPRRPSEGLQGPVSLSLGGPSGALYMASQGGPGHPDALVYRIEDGLLALPEIVLEPEIAPLPVMVNPSHGRFASNGNYLLLGTSITIPVPTLREFDGQTLGFVRDLAIDLGSKFGVVETPDGLSYLVTENRDNRVDCYDITTGQYTRTLIPGPSSPDPYQAMNSPFDIAFGPNGHVYVSAHGTLVQGVPPFGPTLDGGAVHEFDPATGAQIQVIGHADSFDAWLAWPADKLFHPHGMEFKPMPGDYASVGGAFGGNWRIDLDDATKLATALTGPGVLSHDPHSLLSFDANRDGDIDLMDCAAFQRLFGATISH
jgi:hypothetical protein